MVNNLISGLSSGTLGRFNEDDMVEGDGRTCDGLWASAFLGEESEVLDS